MSTNLTQLVEAFAGLNVVVIGEAMLDSYLKGSARGLCPEAPVPVVTLSSRRDLPGGAANTAANIRSLGGHVSLLSVVGDDPESALLRQALEAQGVSTEHLLAQPARRTLYRSGETCYGAARDLSWSGRADREHSPPALLG